jgi:hypothetical protein
MNNPTKIGNEAVSELMKIVRGGFDLTQVVNSFEDSKKPDSNSNINSNSDRQVINGLQ